MLIVVLKCKLLIFIFKLNLFLKLVYYCFCFLAIRYPPRLFVPAICQLFLDGSAPDNVLEVTARAITCYLDISADCTKQIIAIDGVLNGFFNRLVVTDKNSRTNVDLAEQCCKVCI